MDDGRLVNFLRRNSTILVPGNLNRKKSISLNTLPRQDENYLCVPDFSLPNVREARSIEYIYFDPKLASLKKIESYTSLVVPTDFRFADVEIHLYKRRWAFLVLYIIYAALSFMQWIQFSIITNIIMRHYKVSAVAVNWTSMVFMITYIIFIFPVAFLLDTRSLREISIVASTGIAIGSWIKTFALETTRFSVLIFGQIIVAISQIFIIGLPSKLASSWFSPDEFSTVSGLAVCAVQLGIAMGFVTTPWIVRNFSTPDDARPGLEVLYFLNAALTTFVAFIVIAICKSTPKLPPSHVEAIARSVGVTNQGYWTTIDRLLRDSNFLKAVSTYGINTGVLSALSTLLNQIILIFYPESEQDAGNIGLTIIVTGLFGSLIFGFIMDNWHKYRSTSVLVSGLSAFGLALFFFAVESKSKILLYTSSFALGFFMIGYQTVGLELAAELIYPEPDGPANGILNISSHISGILITILLSQINDIFGSRLQHFVFILLVICGTFITYNIDYELKRSFVQKEVETTVKELAEIERDSSSLLLKIEEM